MPHPVYGAGGNQCGLWWPNACEGTTNPARAVVDRAVVGVRFLGCLSVTGIQDFGSSPILCVMNRWKRLEAHVEEHGWAQVCESICALYL